MGHPLESFRERSSDLITFGKRLLPEGVGRLAGQLLDENVDDVATRNPGLLALYLTFPREKSRGIGAPCLGQTLQCVKLLSGLYP